MGERCPTFWILDLLDLDTETRPGAIRRFALSTRNPFAMTRLADVLMEAGRHSEADEVLRMVLKEHPGELQAKRLLK